MKAFYCLLILTICLSCSKYYIEEPASDAFLKVSGDATSISFEHIESSWDISSGSGQILAGNSQPDQFRLAFSGIRYAGETIMPTLQQLYYCDGKEFQPDSIAEAFIRIDVLNDDHVAGKFGAFLISHSNGTVAKEISGRFMIVP